MKQRDSGAKQRDYSDTKASSDAFFEKVKALDKPEAVLAIGFNLTAEMFERMAVECRKDAAEQGDVPDRGLN